MTTIINTTPNQSSDEGIGLGLILGIVFVVLLSFLFYMYGLPMLRVADEKQPAIQKIEIQVPAQPVVDTEPTQ